MPTLVEVHFKSFAYYSLSHGWLADIFSFLRIFFTWIFKKREKKPTPTSAVPFNRMNILLHFIYGSKSLVRGWRVRDIKFTGGRNHNRFRSTKAQVFYAINRFLDFICVERLFKHLAGFSCRSITALKLLQI